MTKKIIYHILLSFTQYIYIFKLEYPLSIVAINNINKIKNYKIIHKHNNLLVTFY